MAAAAVVAERREEGEEEGEGPCIILIPIVMALALDLNMVGVVIGEGMGTMGAQYRSVGTCMTAAGGIHGPILTGEMLLKLLLASEETGIAHVEMAGMIKLTMDRTVWWVRNSVTLGVTVTMAKIQGDR